MTQFSNKYNLEERTAKFGEDTNVNCELKIENYV